MSIEKKINLVKIFIILTILFIPFTTFRIVGLKISEITMIPVIFLYLKNIEINKSNNVFKFVVIFSILIFFSSTVNFFDSEYLKKVGIDSGIYYSYEFGPILKVIRLWIVCLFSIILTQTMLKNSYTGYIKYYIYSTTFVDIIGLIQTFKNGAFNLGIARNRLFAIEPAEAGFINSFSIIYLYIDIFINKNKRISNIIMFIINISMQLFIGSTASIFISLASISIITIIYMIKKKKKKFIVFSLIMFIVPINYLIKNTNIFNKIINYKYYMNIEGSSLVDRISAIETGIKMFKDNYILGVGWGNYGWFVDVYKTNPLFHTNPGGNFSANNQYIVILSELGIIGAFVVIIFLYGFIKKIVTLNKMKSLTQKNNILLYIVIAMTIYLLINAFTLNNIYSFQLWIIVSYLNYIYYSEKFADFGRNRC